MPLGRSNSRSAEPKEHNFAEQNFAERNSVEIDLVNMIRRRALAGSRAGNRASNRALPSVNLGIGDDCALLRLRPGEELALTTDLSIAGRHFELDLHPPEAIGHRALARGLSDLAAMGARPVAAFLSLGIPRQLAGKWLARFFDGFIALAALHKTPLAGGDLAESPLPVADIVLTGAVPRGKALLRSGARPGDLIYVTGALGGSAAGLAKLGDFAKPRNQTRANRRPGARGMQIPAVFPPTKFAALAPHLYPQPRIAQGLYLVRGMIGSAAIDLSDGLSTDLAHLCAESRVAAEIDAASLPIHPGATLDQALHGGEDYELLFTAPPAARIPRRIAGVSVTRIGRILNSRKGRPAVTLLTAKGTQPLAQRGWQHFS